MSNKMQTFKFKWYAFILHEAVYFRRYGFAARV